MKKTSIIFSLVLLAACGPSQEEKQNIAQNACSILGETKKSDSSTRMQIINDAKEKIGVEPFEPGDSTIREVLKFGICEEFIMKDFTDFHSTLRVYREGERRRRGLALKEKYYADNTTIKGSLEGKKTNQLVYRINQQPTKFFKNGTSSLNPDDWEPHGLAEYWDEFGVIEDRRNYKNGKLHGVSEDYYVPGQLVRKTNYKDGIKDGLYESGSFNENRELITNTTRGWTIGNYKNGKKDGLWESWSEGKLNEKENFKDGERHGIWERYEVRLGVHRLIFRGNYKNGKKDGLHESPTYGGYGRNTCYKDDKETDMSYCTE